MEKINVAELLKDCPKGMELDCVTWDNVKFQCVSDDGIWIEYIDSDNSKRVIHLTYYGGFKIKNIETNCVIFPKGKTTWEGFVPPIKYKVGDVVISTSNNIHLISCRDKNNGWESCCGIIYDKFDSTKTAHVIPTRLATEEEKQKLFDAIKANGYKWNPETKTLEKLPQFKVGDRIKPIGSDRYHIIKNIKIDRYILNDDRFLKFTDEHIYELVPNKFDINTLVPFDSRVLVRNDISQLWIPAFWGYKRDNGYTTTFGWSQYCIPYEGNEHLFNTANDCEDYFKTWQKS